MVGVVSCPGRLVRLAAERLGGTPGPHSSPPLRPYDSAPCPFPVSWLAPFFRPGSVPAGPVRAALSLQVGPDFAVAACLPAVAADRAIGDSDSNPADWEGRPVTGTLWPVPPRPAVTTAICGLARRTCGRLPHGCVYHLPRTAGPVGRGPTRLTAGSRLGTPRLTLRRGLDAALGPRPGPLFGPTACPGGRSPPFALTRR
jgi:hypothetical protein